MTNEEKALLDMISFSEGTLGQSNNGYDILIGNRTIYNWTENTSIKHLNKDWYVKSLDSTAAGRYQYIYNSWLSVNGGKNVALSKKNQDLAAIKSINSRLRTIDKTKFINFNFFTQGMDKLALEWASIPISRDIIDSSGVLHKANKSYYSSNGVNKSKDIKSLFDVFIGALNIYKNK